MCAIGKVVASLFPTNRTVSTDMETATALVDFAEIYGWIGLSVAIPFLLFGMDRFDEDARGAYM